MSAVSAAVICEPLGGSAPVQPVAPDAVQDVAFVDVQFSVAVPPLAIVDGVAVNDAVGTGVADTVTVAVTAAVVPPGPVQVNEYAVSAVNAAVGWVPLVGSVPTQPVGPEAVQDVAFVELQVSVEVPPLTMDDGLAVNVAVGAGGAGVTGTDPDPPQAANSSAAAAAHVEYNDRMKIVRILK